MKLLVVLANHYMYLEQTKDIIIHNYYLLATRDH